MSTCAFANLREISASAPGRSSIRINICSLLKILKPDSHTVEGLERYPVNQRCPRGSRDSLERLRDLAVITPSGQQIPLSAVADFRVEDGPPMTKSENARLNGWIFVDIEGIELGYYIKAARATVTEQVDLPSGYSLNWSGQYEYMMSAKK